MAGRPEVDGSGAAFVAAVAVSVRHGFSKQRQAAIRLMAGFGVVGDAHAGVNVQHRSRVARDRGQPNLRQVHLIHGELHDELRAKGFAVGPADMGENITTRGIALLDLSEGTRLRFPSGAEIVITGLRNPCAQLDAFLPGLTQAVLGRDADGGLIRKAGVMAVVTADGTVAPGDRLAILAPAAHVPLRPV
ncbi:MOSC domain-containing protein [Zavarzinia compransoris]|nr:MOSC domain-containing protein [Zavarzinia marina]